ncbi:MAG: nucleoside hydrolase [Nitrososphaeria archaeon]
MTNSIFLDMDPGIDDAVALMMISAHHQWKIAGITALSGNVEVEKTTQNALKIAEAIGVDTEVFKGASRPLVKEAHAAYNVHGHDGLGDSALKCHSHKLSEEYGPIAMIDAARKNRDMWILATGPLTDIAIATILEPSFPKMIGGLVVMGGAYHLNPYGAGNVTRHSEFNIWADPEAADIVFRSFEGAVLIGLDITADPKIWISKDEIAGLKKTARSVILDVITRKFISAYGAFIPHDPVAAYYILEPESFKTQKYCVKVNTSKFRGMTSVHSISDNCKAVNVATHIDAKSFKSAFLKAMET